MSVDTQVIVVGAGPVGLLIALILAKAGVRVTVIDGAAGINSAPRAMAFQPSALAELAEAGVYEDILEHSVTNAVITWWRTGNGPDKERLATISTNEGDKPFLTGLNCSQATVSEIILQHLKKIKHANVFFSHQAVGLTTSQDRVTVSVLNTVNNKTLELTAGWVVGADGGKSAIRKLAGVSFDGFTWPKEEFVATNVYYPFDSYGFTNRNILVDSVNWAVIAKISNDGLWRVAYGTQPGKTDDEIRAELPQRFKILLPGPGKDYKVSNVNKYRPHQRCAARLRKGRVLLAGDAAHLNNPIGGEESHPTLPTPLTIIV